jgi:PKD repeat protein
MRVLRHRRNWYGLAIINTTDNSVNNLVRVAFGNDLANQVPTGSIVATGANRPIDLVTAIHRDTLFALVVSAVNNRIYRLRLDTNANNPVTTEITNPQFNNLEGFQSITLHKVCNEWFAFALADANNKKLYRLSFGNSLSNSPVVRDITFLATQPNGSPLNLQNINVRGVEVAQDGGEHYLFLHTFAGELIRLNFGSTFANNSIIGINFGNIPNFVNVHHFSLLKQASNWYGFGISAATTGVTANQAYRLVFPNNCNASSATDTSKIPQNITYLAAGTYKVSLENYNEFGDVSVVTQNVTVTPVGNLLCNFAQFNAPQFVCAQDTFRPQNTSNTSIAKNYEWDFCAGDLERNPNFQANGTINLTLSGTQNRLFDFFPVYDDVKKMWYAFTVGFDNNDLYRIEYRNGIDNVPTFAQSIGQFGGNATTSSTVFNRPRSIVVFKQNSLWYGLVGNTQNNRILKLNFGTRLDTNNIIIEQFNAPTSPHQLELVNDVKEGWVLLMVGGATPNIGAMWFGKDINNVPVSYIVPNSVNMGGLSSINTISVVRECRNYLAFIGSADGRVLRLNFQGSLLNAPTFTEITGLGFTASTPLDELEAVQEGGTSYLYAMRTVTNGSVGELVRIKFGNSFLNNNPTVSPTLLNVGTRSYGLRFRQQNSRWFAWTVGTGNANLARIDFPNECTATTPAVVNQAKGSIVYNPTIPETPGTRQVITLTAYGENGEVSIFTDSVFVRKPIIANFTFAGNICQGQVITFTNTSQFTVGAIPQSVRWYFGNGDSIVVPNNNPLQNVTYSYPNFGTYKVRLVITDFAGCRSIAERTIIIAPKPTADFIFPAKICSNDSVTFVSTSQAATGKTITQWVWQINGNTVAVGQQPKFVITQTGNVLVTLIVTDDGGCDSSITKTVFVTPGAAVDFTIENACSGDSVIFTNTTNPQGVNISSQTWNVNGVIHTTQNVTQLFPNIGFFSASLLVQNDSGCAVLVTKPFQVRLKPSANISLGQACVNNKIEMELINVITEGTYTAAWNFGDGSPISNELKPTHIYNTAGNYDITATLTTQFGCTNSVSLPTFVEISPTADFSFNNICLGQNAQLSACNESSSNNGSPIGSYSWKLSAGQIIGSSQVCNPPASFAVADTFDVTLRVTNILGCFDTIVKQLIVYPLPQVRFTFDTACVGVPYTFKDSSTVRGQLVQGGSRFWSFGGNAQTVDFTFPSRNVFPVTLTVTSQQGCTSTQTRNITVDNPPVANFNFEAVPTSLQVRFINTSSELGLFPRYAWNFGNGVTSNQRDAVQTFAQEGVYPVSLTVSNNSKCSSTITKDVTVASQARCGVAVEDVIVELRQNRFLIRGRVRNEGNVNVPIVELTAKLANKAILTEQRSVNLLPNGVTDFTLSYQVVNPTVGNFPFICIEAKALNCKNDLDTTNNELCYILESQFQLLDFYPTLANDILRFSYVVPETDNLKIAIYDRTGREVGAFVEEQAQAGVYEKIMNVSNIAHGMYFVRFIYRNQIITRSVVINMR